MEHYVSGMLFTVPLLPELSILLQRLTRCPRFSVDARMPDTSHEYKRFLKGFTLFLESKVDCWKSGCLSDRIFMGDVFSIF